ncbi:MAG: hypothetical protein ACXAAH_05845 [Promethearchaeota archaeon]|jgi:hypothetical protein
MKILAIGPFIGSFEEEILTFRPYARWLCKAIQWDKIYLSTHMNRIFLYDFIPEENIIPVYQHFSRDEKNQKGYVHENLSKKDFRLVLKTFKDTILEREDCNRKDIEIHHLSYSKSTPPYSIYRKIFEEIPDITLKIPKKDENKIILIPAKNEKIEKLAYIKKWLKSNHNDVIVVGSKDTWFSKENVVLQKIDYFENGWKYLIQYITKAKAVICPLSFWTTISNLQNKPVFSWGENPGQYREGGIYNFGNRKNSIIPSDKDTSPDIIIKSMENFINEISKICGGTRKG